jgi:hypothetical protein
MGALIKIEITPEQRLELEAIVARPSEAAGLVRRARVILLSAGGLSGREIAVWLDLTPEHVSVIRSRFRAEVLPRALSVRIFTGLDDPEKQRGPPRDQDGSSGR